MSENVLGDILPIEAGEELQEHKLARKYHIRGALVEQPDGEITRTKMFEILELDLDQYSDLVFTQAEVRRMRMHAMKMKTGIQASMPVMCLGPVKCPFKYHCPIVDKSIKTQNRDINFHNQDASKFPLMRDCPFEASFLVFQRKAYINEFDVDIESVSELGLVNKLAELDLLEWRINIMLSTGDKDGDGPSLIKEQTTGIAHDGTKLTRLEEHPLWGLKERIQKQRMEILDSLVGTRKERYKREAALRRRDVQDVSTFQAEMKARLDSIASGGIIEGDFRPIGLNAPPETDKESEE